MKNGKRAVTIVASTVLIVGLFVSILSGCGRRERHFKEDKFFKLDADGTTVKIETDAGPFDDGAMTDLLGLLGIEVEIGAIRVGKAYLKVPIPMFLDREKSGITFTADGKAKVTLMLNNGIVGILNKYILPTAGAAIGEIDLKGDWVDVYVSTLFPGFTLDDIPRSLDLLESIGLKITGLNYGDEGIKKITDSLKKTGKTGPEITIPENLGLVLERDYAIKKLHSDVTRRDHEAIYLGQYDKNGESYFMFTLTKDDKTGKAHLHGHIEFLNLTVEADEA